MDTTIDLSLSSPRGYTNNTKMPPIVPKIIDLSLYDENYPSIYIHIIQDSITEEILLKIISELHIGYISKIDFIPKINKNGIPYCKAYIYFEKWHWNKNACDIREKIIIHNQYHYCYDENEYFTFKLNKHILTPALMPIKPPTKNAFYEKEDATFYKKYCNQYQKRKLLICDENEWQPIDTTDDISKKDLIIVIPTAKITRVRPKSAPRTRNGLMPHKNNS